uniref:probable receptor-like protein kinase At5g59700 n=1 Tax=Erigeron canadensis TaxID=72917 RepID=UPI001CB8A9BE|nr:probable receptor-like protein kinase At5g59700 [Erigeron canadensis]
MEIDRYRLLLCVVFTMCLMKCALGFEPVDNYLLDCGSTKNTSVGKRVFIAETSDHGFLSNPDQEFVKSADSVRILAPYGSELYTTARIVNTTSNYTFSINQHGRHFVRLYFFPFGLDSGTRNLSSARFSVFAQGFTLLKDFQPYFSPVVKEYSLNVSSDKLVITFVPSGKSFAFLNAIEVVSQPDELIPPTAKTVEVPGNHHSLMTQALETVARVNMGNQTVSPENDTLYRLWNADGPFIKHNSYIRFVSNLSAVNYTQGGPTRDIAPPSVYGTVTKLDTSSNPGLLLNNTWSFNVDPGFSYLVRFHVCDIIERPPSELLLNIYLNSLLVVKDLNLGEQMSNIWGAPYFLDAVTRASGNRLLNVSVGTSITNGNYPESILNGLEIMKISDSKGNLDEDETSRSTKKVWVIAASVGGASLVVVLLGCLFFIISRRNRRKLSQECLSSNGNKDLDESNIFSRSKIGYRFPLIAIQEATDKFSESLVIGVGGFGKVYKGKLFGDTIVAVKRGTPQSRQGLAEFKTEIEMLSQLRHRHLVSLIGYCDECNEMIIIYEYMANGTLKEHLYGSDLPKLSWRQRLEICIGSARGLDYLHTSSSKAIIHRDVKSANILLDENFMAKVADFGLSKDGPGLNQTHVSTAVKGSFGYLDPEYMSRQQLTVKSDVYSFGVVMYEILSGKPVIDPSRGRGMVNLVEWVKECREKGELEKVFDPFLAGKMNMESLKKFLEITDKCLAEEGVDRPTMYDVAHNLEGALALHPEGTEVKTPQMDTISETNHAENGVSSTLFSEASVGDLEGVSMSRVFSEMVKGEKPEMR